MKLLNKLMLACGFCTLMFTSCEDLAFGNKFLQKPPSGDITADTIFSTADYAKRVLTYSYYRLPYGFWTGWGDWTAMHVGNIENLTDLTQSCVGYGTPEEVYYSGKYNAESEENARNSTHCTKRNLFIHDPWLAIRNSWLFIENVDRVPDMSASEKERMKAEAKILIAVQYVDMLRHFGAVPIIEHSVSENVAITDLPPRGTLEDNVKFIVRLLDEAIACNDLPWQLSGSEYNNEKGRVTKASAMGLKVRLLLFVASPLFNSKEPYYAGEAADKKMTWFGNFDQKRWEAARDAGKQFFDNLEQNGGYELDTDPLNPRLGFRKAYFSPDAKECLISSRRHQLSNNNGSLMESIRWGAFCPTKEYFDMFCMKDGTDFDWNNDDHKKNPFINRDPRLNETIVLDGDILWGGKADVVKGDGEDYPQGKTWMVSPFDDKSFATGIAGRKYGLDRKGEYNNQPIHWCILRMAEVYLSYAEALNECGQTAEAYTYLNAVRDRVGVGHLKAGLSKEEFREVVLRERACEFGWEEVRFFDMIRWKRVEDFAKPLHNLFVFRHKDTKEYKFKFPVINKHRAWQGEGFEAKWYLSAFPKSEVNKGYGLIQNPGWE